MIFVSGFFRVCYSLIYITTELLLESTIGFNQSITSKDDEKKKKNTGHYRRVMFLWLQEETFTNRSYQIDAIITPIKHQNYLRPQSLSFPVLFPISIVLRYLYSRE